MQTNQLTALYLTPSILNACVQGLPVGTIKEAMASVRVIWLTGEKVSAKLRAQASDLPFRTHRLLTACQMTR